MGDIIYVCPNCGMESDEPGICLECDNELVATCSVCWNPVNECTCEDAPEESF